MPILRQAQNKLKLQGKSCPTRENFTTNNKFVFTIILSKTENKKIVYNRKVWRI